MKKIQYLVLVIFYFILSTADAKSNNYNDINETCLKSLSRDIYLGEDEISEIQKVKNKFEELVAANLVNSIKVQSTNTTELVYILFPEADALNESFETSVFLKKPEKTGRVGGYNFKSFIFKNIYAGCDKHFNEIGSSTFYNELYLKKDNPIVFYLIPIELRQIILHSDKIQIRKGIDDNTFVFSGVNYDGEYYSDIFIVDFNSKREITYSFVMYGKFSDLESDLMLIDSIIKI